MGGKAGLTDGRFIIDHAGDPEYSLLTRSSDGQMLFLANLLSKMKTDTPLGSRIAEVHSGSSLFTGDAGQGESNIRRWILENDWLEAIIQLPLNMFYNTGISTYIWVLTNRKPENRKGKVQLIDASGWFTPLRKNLGQKNCQLSTADIERIIETFLTFEDNEHSKIFDNAVFGYRKVRVERPLRLRSQCSPELMRLSATHREINLYAQRSIASLVMQRSMISIQYGPRWNCSSTTTTWTKTRHPRCRRPRRSVCSMTRSGLATHDSMKLGRRLSDEIGTGVFDNHNEFATMVARLLAEWGAKLGAADKKALLRGLSWRDETAVPVVKKIAKVDKATADALHGRFLSEVDGKPFVIEYEADPELSDFEQIPLQEEGGVSAFIAHEVTPYAADAWVEEKSEDKIGYEISFTRHFYKPVTLRPLREIEADIRKLMLESDGLVERALGSGTG